jgi:uncharacterized protein YjdB/formylglycine-generating enzyme required for sulfatase activity
MNTGATQTLTATVSPSNATNKAVTWISSNTGVATVSGGVVIAVSAGTAVIVATTADGGKTATCVVTVNQPPASVSLSPTSITLTMGTTTTAALTATVNPSNATNKNVSWSTNNSNVAIMNNGLVTAVGPGSAIITVRSDADNTKTATCSVTVIQPVTGVSLSTNTLSLTTGQSMTLTKSIIPGNASNQEVTWTSSNTGVATVNNGLVTAGNTAGTAIIRVTTVDGGYYAECTVTVSQPIPEYINVNGVSLDRGSSFTMVVGNTATMVATVSPANATNQAVSWSSTYENIATVSQNGLVTAVGEGTTKIIVTTQNGGYTAECTVTVNSIHVTGVTLNNNSLTLTMGGTTTGTLTPTVSPSNATNKAVSWTSSNTGVATVNNGVVTAVAGGSATITVTTADGGYTTTCAVTVIQPVTGVSVSPTSLSLTLGGTSTGTLTPTVSPSNATNKAVTWTSSNTAVATVSGSGVVTAVAAGSATITVRSDADNTKTATCSVTVAAPTVVNALNLTSLVTAPVAGASPVTTGINATQYTGTVAWQTSASVSHSGSFAGSSVYKAIVTLTAKTGYTFTGIAANAFTYTGASSVTNSANSGTVTITFPATGISIAMVSIPAGTFQMGQTDVATPVHSVTVSAFSMGKYEVTQGEYAAVMGSNPSGFSGSPASGEAQERRPVEYVNWYSAIVFCNKLSMLEGRTPAYTISGSTNPADWGTVPASWDSSSPWNSVTRNTGANGYRLPTEAEWEYACRATTTTLYYTGDTISDSTGWYYDNSGSKTHEVGKKPANGWGLYDMHGNVWEWCWDWYGGYSSSAQTNPTGPTSGSYRVERGGSWISYA